MKGKEVNAKNNSKNKKLNLSPISRINFRLLCPKKLCRPGK